MSENHSASAATRDALREARRLLRSAEPSDDQGHTLEEWRRWTDERDVLLLRIDGLLATKNGR